MQTFSLLNGKLKGVRWGKGRRVLALHGFLDNAMSFEQLALLLPGIEIWAIDLPGHGLSSPLPESEGWFLLNWLPLLGDALDELQWDEYPVLGHSLGAILSQLLANVDERITEIFCLDALGPMVSSEQENRDRFKRLYQQRGRLLPFRYYGSYDGLIKSREKGTFPLSHAAATVMAKRAVGMGTKGWFHRYDRRLRQESLWRFSEQDVLLWLAGIQCPVNLLIFNADSWPGYQSVFECRTQAVPDLKMDIIRGSHHLHMEEPSVVAGWLLPRLLL